MIVSWYGPGATSELAVVLATGVYSDGSPPRHVSVHLLATDSVHRRETWRDDLIRAHTQHQPIIAVGLRTAPSDPGLSDQQWADITRRLAGPTLRNTLWVAVRTGVRSAVLLAHLTPSDRLLGHSAFRQLADAVERDYGLLRDHGDFAQPPLRRDPGRPAVPGRHEVRILDARLEPVDRLRRLVVLVDRIPYLDELRFTPYPAGRHPYSGTPYTLYVAVHPGGYITQLLDGDDGQGFNGEHFDLTLVDGSHRTLFGPYSSSAKFVVRCAPKVNAFPHSVLFATDGEAFHRGTANGTGGLTIPAARQALQHVAAARSATTAQVFPIRPEPSAPAKDSYPGAPAKALARHPDRPHRSR